MVNDNGGTLQAI